MKKILAIVLTGMVMSMILSGCGNTGMPAGEAEAEIEEVKETEEVVEEIEEEPEEEIVPEEEAAEEEEVVEEEPEEIPPVPETDEWAANLYQALLADDYKTVMGLTPDPETVRENCAPYEDASWSLWDYETAYRMVMSDGQVMGIILYEFEDESWEIDSFVSYQEGDGFDYTGYGDHQVTLYSDGGYSYMQNGNEVISHAEGQSSFTMEGEDEVWAVWHV